MARFKVGTIVIVNQRRVLVIRYGRDHFGIYAEVKYEDGSMDRVHPSALHSIKKYLSK